MKIKLEIDFGIGVDKDGAAVDPTAVAITLRHAERYLAALVGGCNMVRREGAWAKGEDIIREPGVTLTAICTTGAKAAEAIEHLVPYIKWTLNQECVVVSHYPVTSMLL